MIEMDDIDPGRVVELCYTSTTYVRQKECKDDHKLIAIKWKDGRTIARLIV